MIDQFDIVTEARSYLDVRWQHQGRSREGVDCIGLAIVVGAACRGLCVPMPDYGRVTVDEQMIEGAALHLHPIGLVDMQPGDVVVMGFDRQRHMGVLGDYLYGGLSLIHAYLPNRKVVEQRVDDTWRGRIRAAFRFPEPQ